MFTYITKGHPEEGLADQTLQHTCLSFLNHYATAQSLGMCPYYTPCKPVTAELLKRLHALNLA